MLFCYFYIAFITDGSMVTKHKAYLTIIIVITCFFVFNINSLGGESTSPIDKISLSNYYDTITERHIFWINLLFGILIGIVIIGFFGIKKHIENKKYIERLQKSVKETEEAKRALKYSEGKYLSLIRTLNEGFIFTDTNNKISFLNKKACEILGSDSEDIINKSIYKFLLTPEDVRIYNEKQELRKNGASCQFELQIKRSDSEPIWVNISESPILDDNNKWSGSVAIIVDITERKNYDQGMRELTANLNQKVKQLNCLYDISDLTSIPGITFEEIFLKSLDIIPFGLKYTHDACVEIIFEDQVFRSTNFKETKWSYTVPIKVQKKKLGHIRVLYIEEKPFIHKDPFHFNEKILIKNIAEKLGQVIESKNMENALKESKCILALAHKVARVGDWEWNLNSNKKIFSDSFFEILEMPIEKRYFFDEEMFFKMLLPEERKHVKNIFKKISRHDFSILKFEAGFMPFDGNIKYISFTGEVFRDENQKPLRVIFITKDISEEIIAKKENQVKKTIIDKNDK